MQASPDYHEFHRWLTKKHSTREEELAEELKELYQIRLNLLSEADAEILCITHRVTGKMLPPIWELIANVTVGPSSYAGLRVVKNYIASPAKWLNHRNITENVIA